MDSKMTLDDITRELFAQLRGNENKDFNTLTCPKCSDRLQPLLLDFKKDPVDGIEYQQIWWNCRGLKKKTCKFPLDVPKNVFWTRRTVEQMRQGLIPLPNIHLLPKNLHHLYPSVFNNKSEANDILRISKITTFTRSNTDHEVLLRESQPMDGLSQYFASTPVKIIQHKPSIDESILNSGNLKYGEQDSRRNVELFPDTSSALNSNLSLRFSTDSFLSTINSEMSRKKLIEPPLAIGQKQRLRFANFVDKHRRLAVLSAARNSVISKRLEFQPRKKKDKMNSLKDHDAINLALKEFDETQRARNLSLRLGVNLAQDEPSTSCEPMASCSSYAEHYSGVELNDGVIDIPPNIHDRGSDLRSTATTDSSTTSNSTDISSTRRSKKRKMNDLPIDSLGDAELDKLVQLKFQEVMANARKKSSKSKPSVLQEAPSMPPSWENQEFDFREALHSVSENGFIRPPNYIQSTEPPTSLSDFGEYCPEDDLTYGLEFY